MTTIEAFGLLAAAQDAGAIQLSPHLRDGIDIAPALYVALAMVGGCLPVASDVEEVIAASVIGMRAMRAGEITPAMLRAAIDHVLDDVMRYGAGMAAEMN